MVDLEIEVRRVPSRRLAAVRRRVPVGRVAEVWRPALDEVWAFLRDHPGLRTDGHNVFVYHRGSSKGAPMDVDFGVEVVRPFAPVGSVKGMQTPAGEVATAVHVGSYGQLGVTHDAIRAWSEAHGRSPTGTSWEIYGDWTDDEHELETTVQYLLDPNPTRRGRENDEP